MPGRAALRLALVIVLVLMQSIAVSDSVGLLAVGPVWVLTPLCLGALAASLGFSAASDRAATSWRQTAGDRLRLAVPVYAFAVLGAAFAIGLAVTDAGHRAYLGDPDTFAYLLNLLGWPHYRLPGVFEFNDLPGIVNAVVWVAPLYVVLLAVACLPAGHRAIRLLPVGLAGVMAVAALVAQGLGLDFADPLEAPALLLQGDGLGVILGALLGIAAFRFGERVPVRGIFVVAAVLVLAAMALVGNPEWLSAGAFRIVAAIPTAYLAIVWGLRRGSLVRVARLARRAERYLPGLFLFAFPLQQAAMSRGLGQQGFALNAALAGSAALVMAILFWHGAGRWLVPPRLRVATAGAEDERAFARPRRTVPVSLMLEALAVPLFLGGVSIGAMVLLYIALQPEGAM